MNLPDAVLDINLTDRTVSRATVPENIRRAYLGGRGLNAWLLAGRLPGRIDAFDPANPLLITSGRLTGTEALSSARLQVTAVSPLTGLLGNSNAGGFFGPELTAAGIISLAVTGKAAEPVYLVVRDGTVEFRDAASFWGMKTKAAREAIRAEIDAPKAPVAVIGPAGEKLVRYASILFGPGDAAGRTGMGAVMGAKNLKGIAVVSTAGAIIPRTDAARGIIAGHLAAVKASPDYEEWSTFGDSGQVKWLDDFGAGPAYNYGETQFPAVDTANGYSFRGAPTRYSTCYRCPVRCKAEITSPAGRHTGFVGERPPFEPMAAFGPKCGNPDAFESLYLHTKCNDWGMDSIETGSVLAFAIDLFRRGILTDRDTEGLQLVWGDPESLETLTEWIGARSTRLGNILAEGIRGAAAIIGRGSDRFAFHVKGMAMTSMDPRGFKGTGLGYAVSSRGADFSNPYPSLECGYTPRKAVEIFGDAGAGDRRSEAGKGRMVRYTASVSAVLDAAGLCKIPYLSIMNNFTLTAPAELLTTVTGDPVTPAELLVTGERIVAAERLLNLRLGLRRSDDTVPAKFRQQPIASGICEGLFVTIDPMVNDFYAEMGWDADGVPTPERLQELGLTDFPR